MQNMAGSYPSRTWHNAAGVPAGRRMSKMVPTTTLDDYLLPRLNLRRDDAFDAHMKVRPACASLCTSEAPRRAP